MIFMGWPKARRRTEWSRGGGLDLFPYEMLPGIIEVRLALAISGNALVNAGKAFDTDGRLTDPRALKSAHSLAAAFVQACRPAAVTSGKP